MYLIPSKTTNHDESGHKTSALLKVPVSIPVSRVHWGSLLKDILPENETF